MLQFFVTTSLIITHSLVLLSALANSQHCHSVMTLISLLHSLSLSNPSLSSLAQWLLCCSSVALSCPFPYRTCVCVHVMSHFVCVWVLWMIKECSLLIQHVDLVKTSTMKSHINKQIHINPQPENQENTNKTNTHTHLHPLTEVSKSVCV